MTLVGALEFQVLQNVDEVAHQRWWPSGATKPDGSMIYNDAFAHGLAMQLHAQIFPAKHTACTKEHSLLDERIAIFRWATICPLFVLWEWNLPLLEANPFGEGCLPNVMLGIGGMLWVILVYKAVGLTMVAILPYLPLTHEDCPRCSRTWWPEST